MPFRIRSHQRAPPDRQDSCCLHGCFAIRQWKYYSTTKCILRLNSQSLPAKDYSFSSLNSGVSNQKPQLSTALISAWTIA
jgi:hypothetical protein